MAPDGRSRTVGVLGGMGPAATADFYGKLVEATTATRDQDHIRVLIDSNPGLPCRQAALAGQGPSPGPALRAMAQALREAGAEVLVMPCNTAHAWAGEVRAATDLPFIDMVEATVEAALAVRPALSRAGVLAAGACLDQRLYHDAFAERGVEVLAPEGETRAALMALIGRIKTGDRGAEVRAAMADLAGGLVQAGAEVVIAGCTEVPLVLDGEGLGAPLVNSTDVLVQRTVAFARR
ncbi:MAG: amino acid racemase [Proteobacteria bacterium]|nr:amino acid racemase [Pseudomonadota bacterium]